MRPGCLLWARRGRDSAQEQLQAPLSCVVPESGGDVCRALTKISAQMATKNSTNPRRTGKTRRCLTLCCLFALWGAVLPGQVCAHLSGAGEGGSPGGGCRAGLDGDPRWASWGVGAGGGLSSGGRWSDQVSALHGHLVLVSVGPRVPAALCTRPEPAPCWGCSDGLRRALLPPARAVLLPQRPAAPIFSGPIVPGSPPGFHTHTTGSGAGGARQPLWKQGL